MSNNRETPFMWATLAGSLPLFAAGLPVVSVAYDYAFFLALGLTLDELPSSLSEHVRSAVIWAPNVSVAFILYAVVELALQRVEGGRTEEELVASSPTPRFTRMFRRSGDAVVWIGAVIAAVLGPFYSTDSGWVFFSFTVLWGKPYFLCPRAPANEREIRFAAEETAIGRPCTNLHRLHAGPRSRCFA